MEQSQNRSHRGKKSKDAAMEETPVKAQDADDKGIRVEDEMIGMKRELNDLRDGLNEIKGLLKKLSEGNAIEEKEDKKIIEMGIEPEDEGGNQTSGRHKKPQREANSKKGLITEREAGRHNLID